MSTENPFINGSLGIAEKEDSWSITQVLSNVAPGFKYTAKEFNLIIQALHYLFENLGSGGGNTTGIYKIEKDSFQVGPGLSTFLLGEEDHPDRVDFYEGENYRLEGATEYYVYTKGIGTTRSEIVTSGVTEVPTTITIIKYYYPDVKQTIQVVNGTRDYLIAGTPNYINVREVENFRIEGEFYSYNNITGIMSIDNSIDEATIDKLYITKYY